MVNSESCFICLCFNCLVIVCFILGVWFSLVQFGFIFLCVMCFMTKRIEEIGNERGLDTAGLVLSSLVT